MLQLACGVEEYAALTVGNWCGGFGVRGVAVEAFKVALGTAHGVHLWAAAGRRPLAYARVS